MDLYNLIGRQIEVNLYRHGKYHVHSGRLVVVHGKKICLVNSRGRDIWITKPNRYKDTVMILDKKGGDD